MHGTVLPPPRTRGPAGVRSRRRQGHAATSNEELPAMTTIRIAFDDNLGLPSGFVDALDATVRAHGASGCEAVSFHDVGAMLGAFDRREVAIAFAPAGSLPYVASAFDVIAEASFGPGARNRVTQRTARARLRRRGDSRRHRDAQDRLRQPVLHDELLGPDDPARARIAGHVAGATRLPRSGRIRRHAARRGRRPHRRRDGRGMRSPYGMRKRRTKRRQASSTTTCRVRCSSPTRPSSATYAPR